MPRSLLLLLLGLSTLSADTIEPVTTRSIITTGNGLAEADIFATPTATSINAGVDVSVKAFLPGDSAYVTTDLEAEYVAEGTGSATLTYMAQGLADGSGAYAQVEYQLYNLSGECFNETCTGNLTGLGSETIQLGVPFYLNLTGIATANSPFFPNTPEDASGSLRLSFDITQNGVPVQIEEVALPTPEPSTINLVGVGCLWLASCLCWSSIVPLRAGESD